MGTHITPTDAELELLQILWSRGPLTVRDLHKTVGGSTGYTTTLKLLQIMTEKGLVVRDERQRAHVYCAHLKEADTQRRMLAGLLSKAFRGSTAQLVLQALSTRRASAAELAEIQRLVNRMMKEKP